MVARIPPVYGAEAKCATRGTVAWEAVFRGVGNALISRVAKICMALHTI
jgi:hypothetical protein